MKPYFKDPLAAAWMAKHFDVKSRVHQYGDKHWIPDDRCAMALKVAYQYVSMMASDDGSDFHDEYEEWAVTRAREAIQEIIKIAEGKSDANER